MTIQKTLRIFEFIKGYIASNGVAPTIAEIGRHFQFSSTATVVGHLEKMEEKGLIKRVPNISRGIRIIDQEQKDAA